MSNMFLKRLNIPLLLSLFVFQIWFCSKETLAEQLQSISIYGLSHHFDDNAGHGYNEKNHGIAATTQISKDGVELELGYFKNSFYDDAYWISVQKEFAVSDFVSVIGEVRHWKTKRNSYANRLFQFYPHVRLNLNNAISANVILRESGPIFYIRFNLK